MTDSSDQKRETGAAGERIGLVGVLVSHGFGGGWFSWNPGIEACLYDAEIIAAVERGASEEEITDMADRKWPDGYWGGADGLSVHWIAPGTLFRIDEYDGAESIVFPDDQTWQVAPAVSPNHQSDEDRRG